jgi:NtrC-family two-component system response regulator AlgB
MDRVLKGARVLAIEDDEDILATYAAIFEMMDTHFSAAPTLAEGLKLAATRPFDVLLLDRSIGYDSGITAIPQIHLHAPSLRIIMATAHRDTDAALEALRAGAHDYLVKPFSAEQLRIAVARQVEARRLAGRVEALEKQLPADSEPAPVSASPVMRQMLALAQQVAATDANVLILGESGTGKNVVAKMIHRLSARRDRDFATVNCPSLSAELLENELFGHRKGAFTGANDSADGRVAKVDGGTLFLDEIGDFPLPLQPKLLRFIQDKEYERVGDPTTRRADVRIVAATNRDLADMVRAGTFRQDLFYRINVVSLTLPSLRERREDVLGLAEGFVRKFATAYGRPARGFTECGRAALVDYPWPGNVRELQNVIERAVILCGDDALDRRHLALDISPDALAPMPKGAVAMPSPRPSSSAAFSGSPAATTGGTGAGTGADASHASAPWPSPVASVDAALPRSPAGELLRDAEGRPLSLDALERRQLCAALEHARTLEEAARWLGIDASTLYRKRKAYGLK